MITHQPYPSEVSDAEWPFVVPYLCLLPEDAGQRDYHLRDVFDAARWLVRSGAPWRYLPADFPSPRAVDARVDPALEAVCLKAMAHDPADRYATARALADDLERWLAHEPVSAYRDPPLRALSRWLARHPRVLIRSLVVVATVLGLCLCAVVMALAVSAATGRR